MMTRRSTCNGWLFVSLLVALFLLTFSGAQHVKTKLPIGRRPDAAPKGHEKEDDDDSCRQPSIVGDEKVVNPVFTATAPFKKKKKKKKRACSVDGADECSTEYRNLSVAAAATTSSHEQKDSESARLKDNEDDMAEEEEEEEKKKQNQPEENEKEPQTRRHDDDDDDSFSSSSSAACTLFMAESTIPGAGLGVFSGIDRPVVGETIGTGDVVLPLLDLDFHLHHLQTALDAARRQNNLRNNNNNNNKNIPLNPTKDYAWLGSGMAETTRPYNADSISAFCPGVNAAVNCHLGLVNVAANPRPAAYDTASLHRSNPADPGVGAFTPYYNSHAYTTRPVRAGEELFENYRGDSWFLGRTDQLGLVPLTESYTTAEALVREFHRQLAQNPQMELQIPAAVQTDLWDWIVNDWAWPSRVLNALPRNLAQMETVVHHGIHEMNQQAATRSLVDLKAHGRCLDYIEARPSTIRQAGRGAFATQFLPKGTKVTGSPLLFFPMSDFFAMYDGHWRKIHKNKNDDDNVSNDDEDEDDQIVHYQIMYNYCWSHAESSIIFCPYGTGINYINHGSSSSSSNNNETSAQHQQPRANVKLQWAANGEMGHQDKWLYQSPKHMLPHANPGLFMEVVAIRDIEPNQEIFLDYGREWEAAWEQHQADWKAKRSNNHAADYQSARDWNKANPDAILRTEAEQEEHPYPPYYELRCLDLGRDGQEPKRTFTQEYARNMWKYLPVGGNPCRIIDRAQGEHDGEIYYKVLYKRIEWYDESPDGVAVLPFNKNKNSNNDKEDDEWIESDWILRGVLRFVDAPYSTDLWLDGTFRHLIGFPDEIFPDAWRGEFLSLADLV